MTGLKKRDGLPCLVFNVLVANIAFNTAMLLNRIFTRDKTPIFSGRSTEFARLVGSGSLCKPARNVYIIDRKFSAIYALA